MLNTHGIVQNGQYCALHNETISRESRGHALGAWPERFGYSAIQEDHDIRFMDDIEHGAAAFIQQIAIDLLARKLAHTPLPGHLFDPERPDLGDDRISLRLGLALGDKAAITGLRRVDEVGTGTPGDGVERHEGNQPATTRMNDHGAGSSRISVKEGF